MLLAARNVKIWADSLFGMLPRIWQNDIQWPETVRKGGAQFVKASKRFNSRWPTIPSKSQPFPLCGWTVGTGANAGCMTNGI